MAGMIDLYRMFKHRRARRLGFNCANQHLPAWHVRSRMAAALVLAGGRDDAAGRVIRVADFGCGDTKLAGDLAALGRRDGAGIVYAGYDLHPQRHDVTRLDLLADPLPQGFDVAVVLGVLEYIPDPGAVLQRLRPTARRLVVSYIDAGPVTDAFRRERGWQPLVPPDTFEALLDHAGFAAIERAATPDGVQNLWLAG